MSYNVQINSAVCRSWFPAYDLVLCRRRALSPQLVVRRHQPGALRPPNNARPRSASTAPPASFSSILCETPRYLAGRDRRGCTMTLDGDVRFWESTEFLGEDIRIGEERLEFMLLQQPMLFDQCYCVL